MLPSFFLPQTSFVFFFPSRLQVEELLSKRDQSFSSLRKRTRARVLCALFWLCFCRFDYDGGDCPHKSRRGRLWLDQQQVRRKDEQETTEAREVREEEHNKTQSSLVKEWRRGRQREDRHPALSLSLVQIAFFCFLSLSACLSLSTYVADKETRRRKTKKSKRRRRRVPGIREGIDFRYPRLLR